MEEDQSSTGFRIELEDIGDELRNIANLPSCLDQVGNKPDCPCPTSIVVLLNPGFLNFFIELDRSISCQGTDRQVTTNVTRQ